MTRPRPRAAALLLAPVLTLALAGCGGGGSDAGAGGAPPVALSEKQAAAALLTVADVPRGFTPSNAQGTGQKQTGCLVATDTLDAVRTDVDERAAFVTAFTGGASGVLSQVRSDADPNVLTAAFDTFRDAVGGCTSVSTTTPQGVHIDLTISVDTDPTDDSVSQQVHLDAVGTVVSKGTSLPYHVAFDVSLVRGSLATVATYDLGRANASVVDSQGALDTLVVDRLSQAAAG